jgi:hypothetical protein
MTRSLISAVALGLGLAATAPALAQTPTAATVRLSTEVLRDKIKGGWAGQVIGVTFGGPTEFRYNGTMIPAYTPIRWDATRLKESYDKSMGLYDDIYVDLTFVNVVEAHGPDATAEQFAEAFAKAGYQLWHANQMARYNLLRGMKPPESGHWTNNPDADDIDFQIEADFIGLMTPGLPRTAATIADRVGHIMNSGDGWYGGVYVATMYSQAFVAPTIRDVVTKSLAAIPASTRFHQTIRAAIDLHDKYPDDWQRAWFELQRQYAEDIGCTEGVFVAFDIDARLNAAYVVLGLLYGNGDFTKTIAVATRSGQDSDCNPSSAAGILGAFLGYSKIPAFWTQGLADVEATKFPFANLSLEDAYRLSEQHARRLIREHGGTSAEDHVAIALEPIAPVKVEQNFEGHFPVAEIVLRQRVTDEATFTFDGIGFAVQGGTRSQNGDTAPVLGVVSIDGRDYETIDLPAAHISRRYAPFWAYGLPEGRHTVRIKLRNPAPDYRSLWMERVIVYGSAPKKPPV